MHIDWSALAEVFGIAIGATVVVVVFFSVGITALARRRSATEGGTAAGPTAAAVLCFLACVAVVGYGLYLIVVK